MKQFVRDVLTELITTSNPGKLTKKEKQQLKGDGYSKRAAIKHFKSKKVSQMLSYFSPKLFNFTTIFIIFQNLQKQLSLIFRFLHFEIKNYMDGGE